MDPQMTLFNSCKIGLQLTGLALFLAACDGQDLNAPSSLSSQSSSSHVQGSSLNHSSEHTAHLGSSLASFSSLAVSSASFSSAGMSNEVSLASLHFPDAALKRCIDESGAVNVSDLKVLRCVGVEDSTGLPLLTALEELYLERGTLKSIDVMALTHLRALAVSYNQLTSLDISQNTLLEHLAIRGNKIKVLDLDSAPHLTQLFYDKLYCEQVKSLTSQHSKLQAFGHACYATRDSDPQIVLDACGGNIHRDLFGEDSFREEVLCPRLDAPYIDQAIETCILAKQKRLDNIEVLNCEEATSIHGIEYLPNLRTFSLRALRRDASFSQNLKLEALDIGYVVADIDLSKNSALTQFSTKSLNDHEHDVTFPNESHLERIHIVRFFQKTLDFSAHHYLKELILSGGKLNELRLPSASHTQLEVLNIVGTYSLDFVSNVAEQKYLRELSLSAYNSELSLNQMTDLTKLYIERYGYESLDLSANSKLEHLSVISDNDFDLMLANEMTLNTLLIEASAITQLNLSPINTVEDLSIDAENLQTITMPGLNVLKRLKLHAPAQGVVIQDAPLLLSADLSLAPHAQVDFTASVLLADIALQQVTLPSANFNAFKQLTKLKLDGVTFEVGDSAVLMVSESIELESLVIDGVVLSDIVFGNNTKLNSVALRQVSQLDTLSFPMGLAVEILLLDAVEVKAIDATHLHGLINLYMINTPVDTISLSSQLTDEQLYVFIAGADLACAIVEQLEMADGIVALLPANCLATEESASID